MKLEVAGTSNADGSLNAEVVTVEHERVSGSVTAISGKTLTIQVCGKDGKGADTATGTTPTNGSTTTTANVTTKTITVSGSTVYLESGQSQGGSGHGHSGK